MKRSDGGADRQLYSFRRVAIQCQGQSLWQNYRVGRRQSLPSDMRRAFTWAATEPGRTHRQSSSSAITQLRGGGKEPGG